MTKSSKIKLYVGCSLTHAPETFKNEVENLKKQLRKNYEVFDFVGLTAGTAREVYEWDIIRCVGGCDLFLAICDFPSIGLGYEIAMRIEKFGKPTLAVAHKKSYVTRVIQGIEAPEFSFKRYNHMLKDVPELLKEHLDTTPVRTDSMNNL